MDACKDATSKQTDGLSDEHLKLREGRVESAVPLKQHFTFGPFPVRKAPPPGASLPSSAVLCKVFDQKRAPADLIVDSSEAGWLSHLEPPESPDTPPALCLALRGAELWCVVSSDVDKGKEMSALMMVQLDSPIFHERLHENLRNGGASLSDASHSVLKYDCPYCGIKYSGQGTLNAHIASYCTKKPIPLIPGLRPHLFPETFFLPFSFDPDHTLFSKLLSSPAQTVIKSGPLERLASASSSPQRTLGSSTPNSPRSNFALRPNAAISAPTLTLNRKRSASPSSESEVDVEIKTEVAKKEAELEPKRRRVERNESSASVGKVAEKVPSPEFKCPLCDFRAAKYSTLQAHTLDHLMPSKEESDDPTIMIGLLQKAKEKLAEYGIHKDSELKAREATSQSPPRQESPQIKRETQTPVEFQSQRPSPFLAKSMVSPPLPQSNSPVTNPVLSPPSRRQSPPKVWSSALPQTTSHATPDHPLLPSHSVLAALANSHLAALPMAAAMATATIIPPHPFPVRPELYCFECAIQFNSQQTFTAHKKFYCEERRLGPAYSRTRDSTESDSPRPTPPTRSSRASTTSASASPASRPPTSQATPPPTTKPETPRAPQADKQTAGKKRKGGEIPLDLSVKPPTPPVISKPSPIPNDLQRSTPTPKERNRSGGAFRCDSCSISFSKEENFRTHKLFYCAGRRSGVPSERCIPCGIEFPSMEELVQHSSFVCPFQREVAALRHSSSVLPDTDASGMTLWPLQGASVKMFLCNKCGSLCDLEGTTTHTCRGEDGKSSPASPPMVYPCTYCEATFISPAQVKDHVRSQHQSTATFRCKLCGYRGQSPRGMRMHGRSHQGFDLDHHVDKEITGPTAKRSPAPFPIAPPFINPWHHLMAAHSSDKYEGHLHTSPRDSDLKGQVECEKCKKSLPDVATLVTHMQQHHGSDKELSCLLCDFKTSTKIDLVLHVKYVHTPQKTEGKSVDKAEERRESITNSDVHPSNTISSSSSRRKQDVPVRMIPSEESKDSDIDGDMSSSKKRDEVSSPVVPKTEAVSPVNENSPRDTIGEEQAMSPRETSSDVNPTENTSNGNAEESSSLDGNTPSDDGTRNTPSELSHDLSQRHNTLNTDSKGNSRGVSDTVDRPASASEPAKERYCSTCRISFLFPSSYVTHKKKFCPDRLEDGC